MDDSPREITNPIVQVIDRIARERSLSWSQISRDSGLSPDFISKLEGRGPRSSANARNLINIANTLEIDASLLLNAHSDGTPQPSASARQAAPAAQSRPRGTIPILGSAAGSAIGTFVISNNPIGYVRRPPALEFVENAYALYVENESMSPAYAPGALVFVNPTRPANAGDTVIIQTRSANGETQAWIKYLVRKTSEWVVTRQLNPDAEIKFKRDQVISVHKVPSMAELFGA